MAIDPPTMSAAPIGNCSWNGSSVLPITDVPPGYECCSDTTGLGEPFCCPPVQDDQEPVR